MKSKLSFSLAVGNMKKTYFSLFLMLVILVSACTPVSAPPVAPTTTAPQVVAEPSATPGIEPSPTPGQNMVVNSAQDSGPGSLRQAIQEAQPGDTITFDPAVFPPDNPTTIQLLSGLPPLDRGNITLDSSNAGVVLDGSQAGGEWQAGIDIRSIGNVVMGLEIAGFSGPGIILQDQGGSNQIGGDRKIGSGPFGQGNLIRQCAVGIAVRLPDNQIAGNIIGTDLAGKEHWGNVAAGIFLEENANRNVIGPDNLIAYNGTRGTGGGVNLHSTELTDNIHDNADPDIYYNISQGAPKELPKPPVLLDFDLKQGKVSGVACANCTLEFFTTDESGAVFEGSARADANGHFEFQKGSEMSGAFLRATAYGEGINNTEFSAPVTGQAQSLGLQSQNSNPKQSLLWAGYQDLAFNGIGTMQYIGCTNEQDAVFYAQQSVQLGTKWTRVSADWYDWPEVELSGEYSDFDINPCQERAIDLLNQQGTQLLYTIVYWDPEIQITPGYSRFRTQAEIDHYLEYVRFIVGHFRGKVQWYGILNEPNLSDGQRAVRVEDYINLARQAIPVIKEIDPQAKVVIGEVTPLNESGAFDYLKAIIASDVVSMADGLAWHGSSGNSLDYLPDVYRQYPGWLDQIVSSARANGFSGQFFATELQFRTEKTAQMLGGERVSENWYYSNAVSGKYYARSMVAHLARGFWITVGHEGYQTIPQAVQVFTSLTRVLAGAQPENLQVNFANPSAELRSVAFSLPNGSRLVAVWRDVKAVDDDPGVENTVLFPHIQAEKVTGIDPLYAYQQELVFTQNGGLSIPGYLVHDYPTFILLDGFAMLP